MHCDVVIVGYRLNAKEPAPKALERILGLTPEAARKLSRGFPSVVRHDISEAEGASLAEQLTAAGALVELRAPAQAAAPPPPSPPPPAPKPASRLDRFTVDLDADLELDLSPPARPSPPKRAAASKLSLPPMRAGNEGAPGRGALPVLAGPGPRLSPAAAPAASRVKIKDSAPNYQLGDFGLAQPRGPSLSGLAPVATQHSVVAPLPTSVAPPAAGVGGGLELELDLSSGLELELDRDEGESLSRRISSRPPDNDLHTLNEDFGRDTRAIAAAPDVEQSAFRAIQRAPKSPEARRSLAPAAKKPSELALALREWLPAVLLLVFLVIGSIAAVGYALDPSDIVGALTHEQASMERSAGSPARRSASLENLHPLLRATPALTRAPLAAILRARIGGVHEVPVSFGRPESPVHCCLVELREGETATRLARLRETGREVPAPSDIRAQLLEHERALRSESHQPALQFAQVCLTL